MYLGLKTFFVGLFIVLSFNSYSAAIKGHVYDKSTKEQLVGAYVTLKSVNKGAVSELDGSFAIKDIEPGSYVLSVTYLGFDLIDSNITITDKNQVVKIEIDLKPVSHVVGEVEIKAKAYGGSDEYATKAEQRSISLVNIVSANAILISPDITVANVMQRISGVVMDRGNNGDAQYPIIRGMDKRYNTTLVNGIKIPSPNGKDRYVPLDIFPAELLERLEVFKSLLPSMEGDGTGGVVNLVMKNAPAKLMIDANVGVGYSDIFQRRDFLKYDDSKVSMKSPAEIKGPGFNASVNDFPYNNFITKNIHTPVNSTASVTLGNRFFKNRLGVIISGSFQDTYKGTNTNEYRQVATVQPVFPGAQLVQPVSDYLVRNYSYRIDRVGTEAKMDYDINDKNSISLFATYLQLNEYRVRITDDSTLGGYSRASGFVGPNAYHKEIQTQQTLQSIYNSTLQGKHKILGPLELDWTLAASQATKKVPDIASFSTDNPIQYNPKTDVATLGPTEVGAQSRAWLHNTDKDLSGYLNLHYQTELLPTLKKIDFGGMYRNKERNNYYNQYHMNPIDDSGNVYESFKSITASKYYFLTNAGLGNGNENAGTYVFTENISAYYLQLHDEIGAKLKIDGGFRVENTYQDYISSLPVSIAGKSATYAYSDFLPSIMTKYELSSTSALRASYFKSINRPAFADVIPFLDYSANESYPSIGNPTLQRSLIDNYDLRYELFPKGLDQLLVVVFYKHLQNPIEYGLYQGSYAAGLSLTPTNNASPANNYGIELVYRKYIGNFGVAFNYTYTKSVVKSGKRLYIYDSTLKINQTHNDTTTVNRPLQDQADHIGNLSFLYKDANSRIDAELSFNYTDEKINTISAFKGLDTWEKPTFSMDFSIQKKFAKRLTVYFKANNLLNTGTGLFIKQPNDSYTGGNKLAYQESANYFNVQRNIYYSSYLLGLRFKL